MTIRWKRAACAAACALTIATGAAVEAFGAANEQVRTLAAKERSALLETLKELTAIESGSRGAREDSTGSPTCLRSGSRRWAERSS